MKIFVGIVICLSLVGFTVAHVTTSRAKDPKAKAAATSVKHKKTTGKKADAKTLLTNAKKALAAMVKAARADKGLDPKTPKNKPFWKSIQAVAKSLKTAEKGLGSKSNDFFKGITDAREAEQQLKVDWQLTGSKNKAVIENGKKLGHALARLRTGYSKEAARKKKSGELTAHEKAQFEKIKTQQKDLLAKVKKLQTAAQKDKALEKGLRKIESQANHIIGGPITLDAYLATLYLLDQQIGLIRGYEYYVDKAWRTDYMALDTIAAASETIYVDWMGGATYDWVWVDTPVDIYVDEDFEVTETITTEEITTGETYAETESFDMSESEQEEVATEENTDEEVDADDTADDDSMDDSADDDGDDMSNDADGDDGGDDGDDDGGGDDGGDDDGGDDGE